MIVKKEISFYDDKIGKAIKLSKKDIGVDVSSLYDNDGNEKKNDKKLQRLMDGHSLTSCNINKIKPKQSRIAKLYNHEILHVLSHRLDEEAHAYVKNYAQFRNSNRPLVFDITNMRFVFKVIIHQAQNLPLFDANGLSDPYCKVKLSNTFRDLSYYDEKTMFDTIRFISENKCCSTKFKSTLMSIASITI